VREAKALAPSAWDWAHGRAVKKVTTLKIRYQKALDTAIRVKDPFVHLEGKWIVRRLAPDCSRVVLAQFPKAKEESRLLHAMGWETANLHIGGGATKAIVADLKEASRKLAAQSGGGNGGRHDTGLERVAEHERGTRRLSASLCTDRQALIAMRRSLSTGDASMKT